MRIEAQSAVATKIVSNGEVIKMSSPLVAGLAVPIRLENRSLCLKINRTAVDESTQNSYKV